MKTLNSTPWCNLYSTALKYDICVKPSRYRNLLWLSGCLFFNLLLISYITYAYQFLLVIVVLTITFMSILIAKKSNEQLTTLQFTLDEYHVYSFEDLLENTIINNVSRKEHFQLLASSRYSFFGCWLHMAPLSNLSLATAAPLSYTINKKGQKKWLFIYRDSLSAQDFSRLSQIIRKLTDTS